VSSANRAFGAQVSSHPVARGKFWLIPLGVVMAAGGLFTSLGPFLFPDPRLSTGGAVVIAILGLMLTLLGAMASVRIWRQRKRRVDVYEHGVVEQVGTQRTEILWDEVSSLVCERVQLVQAVGLVSQSIARFCLKTKTGKVLVLDQLLVDIAALGSEVELQVSRCLLPKVRARIAAGERVDFAPLSASLQGLARGEQTLAWNRLAGAQVAHGEVRIFAEGEPSAWAKVRYGKLSNAQTLLELISGYAKHGQP
jgi:hypothetical protein